MEASKKIIKDLIEKEYKDYPDLADVKERLKNLYIKEYEHLSKNKSYFNLEIATEDEMIEQVYIRMKESFIKIAPGLYPKG